MSNPIQLLGNSKVTTNLSPRLHCISFTRKSGPSSKINLPFHNHLPPWAVGTRALQAHPSGGNSSSKKWQDNINRKSWSTIISIQNAHQRCMFINNHYPGHHHLLSASNTKLFYFLGGFVWKGRNSSSRTPVSGTWGFRATVASTAGERGCLTSILQVGRRQSTLPSGGLRTQLYLTCF